VAFTCRPVTAVMVQGLTSLAQCNASGTCTVHQALKQVIAMKAGRCSGMKWQRPPGRPRKTWMQQIGYGTTTSWTAGDMRGRIQRSVDIVESRRNGPQSCKRHDDDDDLLHLTHTDTIGLTKRG